MPIPPPSQWFSNSAPKFTMVSANDPLLNVNLNDAPDVVVPQSTSGEPPRTDSVTSVSSVSSRSTRASVSSPPTEVSEFGLPELEKQEPYQEKYLRPRWHWAILLIRLALFLTAGAMVGISFYVAVTAGAAHSQKIYAAVIVSGILAMSADIVGIIVLLKRPRASPIVSVGDGVVILLGAIGIPSILLSGYATSWDQIACILQGVVMVERLLSIVISLSICHLESRKRDNKMKPLIVQRRVSSQEGFARLSQLPGGPVAGGKLPKSPKRLTMNTRTQSGALLAPVAEDAEA